MNLTPSQQAAVAARGNVLVTAGAGTGKTHTMVERCLARLLDAADPVSLDEILMVTFTEAAAAEMRGRIRQRLEALLKESPGNVALERQTLLLDTAHIRTLHSFCLELARQHFQELQVDPQFGILAEDEAHLLADETLDALLSRHYAGSDPRAEAVRRLIQTQTRGWDQPVRDVVLRLHRHAQTLPNPDGWMEQQRQRFLAGDGGEWAAWLLDGLRQWRAGWLPLLQRQDEENTPAHQCAAALEDTDPDADLTQFAAVSLEILEADEVWPAKRKEEFRKPIEKLFDEAAFFQSVLDPGKGGNALAEDWSWARPHLVTLLDLAREFGDAFAAAKRQLAAVDFHDLEQFALRLLRDPSSGSPTDLALSLRRKLRLVFVDEYQDINAAQDAILTALSRDGAEANRFLVGDVKQSIYRFRLANPRIFQEYRQRWAEPGPDHQVIALSDNYRSQETILNFVNAVFADAMQPELGGVGYPTEERLRFGKRTDDRRPPCLPDPPPGVEVHLRIPPGKDTGGGDEAAAGGPAELSNAEQEAGVVARRLAELRQTGFRVWIEEEKIERGVEWKDMVILLRSPGAKAESYAKVFERLGIPLNVARGGFLQAVEVTDLLSLLSLIDNPLQDLPLLAVLRSPIVGLSLETLAQMRVHHRRGRIWTALLRWQREAAPEPDEPSPDGWERVNRFLHQYSRWRQMARHASLSERLESILDETGYLTWVATLDRGAQRRANLEQLLALARRFDRQQRPSLFRFLRFVEARQEAELDREPSAALNLEGVRLMSIHQSKGLEFPVVVVADLGKPFNFSDLHSDLVLDEQYGLCPLVKPPGTEQQYPSVPLWLARRRQRRETLGEELRLLYVAMTRARERLLLVGTASASSVSERWPQAVEGEQLLHRIAAASRHLDWLGPWLTGRAGIDWIGDLSGHHPLFEWSAWKEADAADGEIHKPLAEPDKAPPEPLTADELTAIRDCLSWQYPHDAATREPAKTSVSVLRRRAAEEAADEAHRWFGTRTIRSSATDTAAGRGEGRHRLNATEIGLAHHAFLQFARFEKLQRLDDLRSEAARLEETGVLSPEEVKGLEFEALHQFWTRPVGSRILEHRKAIQRELPFTARFAAGDLAALGLPVSASLSAGEFVIIQGVADLVVTLPSELWLLDFKTDDLQAAEVDAKAAHYRTQVALYAMALSRIYRRPVTAAWLHFLRPSQTVVVDLPGTRTLAESPGKPT